MNELVEAKPIAEVEGTETYKTHLTNLCDLLYESQSAVVQSYWTIGEILHHYVNEQVEINEKATVSSCLKALSEDVHAVSGGVLSYSNSTLRNMLRFRENISATQLKRLVDIGCPVSKALPMCVSDMDDKDRDQVIDELESGSLDTANIPERVKELKPLEDREEGRGNAPSKGPFKTVTDLVKALDKVAGTIESDLVMHCATVFASGDDEAIEAFYAQLLKLGPCFEKCARVFEPIKAGYIK